MPGENVNVLWLSVREDGVIVPLRSDCTCSYSAASNAYRTLSEKWITSSFCPTTMWKADVGHIGFPLSF